MLHIGVRCKSLASQSFLNLLNAELNSICLLLALVGTHHILHVSMIRVKRSRNVHISDNDLGTVEMAVHNLLVLTEFGG